MISMKRPLSALLAVAAISSGVARAEGIAEKAREILSQNCYRCHGGTEEEANLNVLDYTVLTADPIDVDETPFIVASDLDKSRLWAAIDSNRMPPTDDDSGLSAEDRAVIREWIESGAARPRAAVRPQVTELDVMLAIRNDLQDPKSSLDSDRRFKKYFSIAHLHNNATISDEDLKVYRAALSKAVNSMSSEPAIRVPRAVDQHETVFVIDLRHYGWEQIVWRQVLEEYPYGFTPSDQQSAQVHRQIRDLMGKASENQVFIRGDWFVNTATRPKLYHLLAKIPETLQELYDSQDVDFEKNFETGTLRRAGMFKSGVSEQNRLVEYHSSRTGRFWISYDFEEKAGRSNLARFPLGPKFEENNFGDELGFEHAGGEIIYDLPNGLHGYMLIADKGQRIPEGPISIVWDKNRFSGSPQIVNGLSCIGCHDQGIKDLKDDVRSGHALENNFDGVQKILQLYAPQEELQAAISESRRKYQERLLLTIGPALGIKSIDELPTKEPISEVVKWYTANIDLETAACELGFTINGLQERVKSGPLNQLGLKPLSNEGGTIKRSYWESQEAAVSVFQQTVTELGIGVPSA